MTCWLPPPIAISLASQGYRGAILGGPAAYCGSAGIGIVIPEDLITDCVRLCCSLCLLENDPEIDRP